MASIDWGCAVQIMAAASIGSNESFTASNAETLYVDQHFCSQTTIQRNVSGVYVLVVLTHAVICCLATRVLARLQTVYVVLNVLFVVLFDFPYI